MLVWKRFEGPKILQSPDKRNLWCGGKPYITHDIEGYIEGALDLLDKLEFIDQIQCHPRPFRVIVQILKIDIADGLLHYLLLWRA